MTTTLNPPVRTSVGNYFISNYPPFSCWKPENIPSFLHALEQAPATGPLGLYVHLPFCRQRCQYCYFRVYPRRAPEDIGLYIEAVLKELSLYRQYPPFQRPFSSVYFGGGSPSYLSSEQIRRLIGGLQESSDWNSVQECTFECEPGTLTPEKLHTLKQLGVTRLTLGFQSLDDSILRRNGRAVTVQDCLNAYRMAREAGFDQINIDLLAGLPGETEATWQRTIEQVIQLAPDCATIYQFELTHNSAIYSSIQAGRNLSLPSWPTKRRRVAEAFEAFEGAGYVIGSGYMAIRDPAHWRFIYTVEHFWHGQDLLALGETAFGHLQGVHYQNADTFDKYVRTLARNELPVRRALRLPREEKLRREVILLLKTGALDASYFRKKFGVELVHHFGPQLEELVDSQLLEVEGDCLRLTREGLLEVDWLLPKFYLPEHLGVRYT